MKIGIDITSLIYQRGVARYTRNLVRALRQLKANQLYLYGYSLRRKTYLKKQCQHLLNPTKNKSAAHQASNANQSHPEQQFEQQMSVLPIPNQLQSWLWRLGINKVQPHFPQLDVFHSWDWLQPPDKNLPLVSTIHDLAILKYPDTAHPKIVKAHRRSWRILQARQAEIIAVSQATKKDIVEMLQIPQWHIHVVPEALPIAIEQTSQKLNQNPERYEQLQQQLNLNQPYILFVGTREPRKNLQRLIQAWQPLADDLQLLVAGASGWGEDSQPQRIHSNLRFLGRVSDEQLSVLYSEAEVFAYPSLYEGFGLPILEAFYHGTPVVTSDRSAMIEVAGNAAQLVEPESVDSIRQGLESILNETEAEQKTRIQRMIIRLHMFSWHKVAQETMAVYQQALENYDR